MYFAPLVDIYHVRKNLKLSCHKPRNSFTDFTFFPLQKSLSRFCLIIHNFFFYLTANTPSVNWLFRFFFFSVQLNVTLRCFLGRVLGLKHFGSCVIITEQLQAFRYLYVLDSVFNMFRYLYEYSGGNFEHPWLIISQDLSEGTWIIV